MGVIELELNSPAAKFADWLQVAHDALPLDRFLGLPAPDCSLGELDLLLFPVAYDGTTCARPGARFGPRAMLEASLEIETFDPETGRDLEALRIETLPCLPQVAAGPQAMVTRVAEVLGRLLALERRVVLLGGEHSLTIGALQAHCASGEQPLCVALDAHADLRREYQGSSVSHACVSGRAFEMGLEVLVAGWRSISREEWELSRGEERIRLLGRGELSARGLPLEVLESIRGRRAYLSIDLDVLDPAIMPAVGTPEPDGLSWRELLVIIDQLFSTVEIVGIDIMELSPIPSIAHPNFLAACLLRAIIARWMQRARGFARLGEQEQRRAATDGDPTQKR
jgi:agmatinase